MSFYKCMSFVVILLFLGFDFRSCSAADENEIDCGIMSLYSILHMEGHKVTLVDILNSLPKRPPLGYSMKQIRDTAAKFGLSLVGMHLPKNAQCPSESFLVFLNQDGHGHFAVLRPVGQRRKLVQVFDNNLDLLTVDFNDAATAPDWTGLVLIKKDSMSIPSVLLVFSTTFILFLAFLRILSSYKLFKLSRYVRT